MIDLKTCRKLKDEIEKIEEKLKCIEDSLKRMTPSLDGLPKNQTQDDRLGKLISLKIEMENELSNLRSEKISAQVEMIGVLSKVKTLTVDEENILIRRYGFCDEWQAITAEMAYTAGHVFHLHRRALEKIGAKR